MKKTFIFGLSFFLILIILYVFFNTFFVKEGLDTNDYPNISHFNTLIPCNNFCSKIGKNKEDCETLNQNLRCLNTNGQIVKPNCFYNIKNKCTSFYCLSVFLGFYKYNFIYKKNFN